MAGKARDIDGFSVAVASVMVHVGIGLVLWAAIDAFVARPPDARAEIAIDLDDTPPPPPPKRPEPEPEPVKPPPDPAPVVPARVEPTRPSVARTPITPPPEATPPPLDNPAPGPSTGETAAPVLSMPDLGINSTGTPVSPGPRRPGGGSGGDGGGGGGGGSGSGSAAAPVSIASLKRRAQAKGGQDYFDASKDYPDAARRQGIEGKIRVKLEIGADGAVRKATLLNKLGHGLDEIARDRAAKLTFEPALDGDDRAVASVEVWTFTFTVPK